jgi:predicted anti-sigma-YlaC factor YlaD
VDCSEVLEQLADYLDPDARQELCREIERHLSSCRGCRVEVDTVKKTIVLYQADREVHIPAPVQTQLEAALAHEYGAHGPITDPRD